MRKGFVERAGKHLHYVRAGDGPALVMLHASPCSAKVMAPLQALLATRFTSLAFDLPGFGFSDPLDADPLETHHLADAIADAIRALGLTQAALYGRHTGAGVAVELAHRHPDLVSMVLTNGFPVFTHPYTPERLAQYLPPIEPRWDGGHLVWTFFRYREQHIFWPWDRPLPDHRADTDVPDLEFLYRGALEMLQSGANYPSVYASAFRHPGLAMIGEVKPPVCFGNRPGDSQHRTMPLYPAAAWTHAFPRDPLEAAAQEARILALHPTTGQVPPHGTWIRLGTPRAMDYVPTRDGDSFVLAEGLDRPGMPLILLPELPGSVTLHEPLVRAVGAHRPVLAIDPAGNGRSTLPPGQPVSVERWAEQLEHVLAALRLDRVAVLALGTAAAIAVEFAQRGRAAAIILQSPPATPSPWADAYAPDITPSPDAANFLRLWHHLRDQQLWFPCFAQGPAHARANPDIDPTALHARAVPLLANPQHYRPTWRALLAHPLDAALARLTTPLLLTYRDTDLFAPDRARAAVLAATDPVPLPDDPGETARLLDAWLTERTP